MNRKLFNSHKQPSLNYTAQNYDTLNCLFQVLKYENKQATQDVVECVTEQNRTDLEKCSITSLAHQWILCSEWVPSEWGVQTADKNIIIHTTDFLVHQLTSCEVKAACCKKQIHH